MLYKHYTLYIFFAGILTKIFTELEGLKFEMETLAKTQEAIKAGIDALLVANNNISINKFSRLLPITSIESFNEIDESLANSEEDFVLLVNI